MGTPGNWISSSHAIQPATTDVSPPARSATRGRQWLNEQRRAPFRQRRPPRALSAPVSWRRAASRLSWRARLRPRTWWSRRWRTQARPSGISPTSPGSSRPSCSAKHLAGYRVFDETFNYCFNSYYESQGKRQPRPKRGLLTRPSAERVLAYRAHVDAALEKLFAHGVPEGSEIARLIEVGINHEQQHQELLLTDILALFAANPLRPAYRAPRPRAHRAGARPHPLDRLRGRHCQDRTRRPRLCLGQRGAASRRAHPSVPACRPARHQRRMARIHGR